MTISIIIGIAILALTIAWVVRPLFTARQARQQLDADGNSQLLENLLFEREVSLVAIRDLKLDHEMGKLSDEDFAQLDTRYRAHAIQILRQLDELGVSSDDQPVEDSLDDWIERAVANVREGKAHMRLAMEATE